MKHKFRNDLCRSLLSYRYKIRLLLLQANSSHQHQLEPNTRNKFLLMVTQISIWKVALALNYNNNSREFLYQSQIMLCQILACIPLSRRLGLEEVNQLLLLLLNSLCSIKFLEREQVMSGLIEKVGTLECIHNKAKKVF